MTGKFINYVGKSYEEMSFSMEIGILLCELTDARIIHCSGGYFNRVSFGSVLVNLGKLPFFIKSVIKLI